MLQHSGAWSSATASTVTTSRDWAGGVAFDSMSPDDVPTVAKVWEDAIRKLQGGFMPPPNAKQHPDLRAVTELVSWLEGTLDNHANSTAGRIPLRRPQPA